MNKFNLTHFVAPLRRYARVLTRTNHEADDLVQGALLRAVERRATFHEGGDLRVWLMAMLHNHFIDQTRARKAAMARDHAWAETNPGFSPPEGEHVVRFEQLRRAYLALPADQREALHLMAIEGLTVAETSAILGIPAGTVMSHVGRARAALRQFEDRPATKPNLTVLRGRDEP